MSSLGLLETKIIPKRRTPGSYCHCCDFCGGGVGLVDGGGALVVGGGISPFGDASKKKKSIVASHMRDLFFI